MVKLSEELETEDIKNYLIQLDLNMEFISRELNIIDERLTKIEEKVGIDFIKPNRHHADRIILFDE